MRTLRALTILIACLFCMPAQAGFLGKAATFVGGGAVVAGGLGIRACMATTQCREFVARKGMDAGIYIVERYGMRAVASCFASSACTTALGRVANAGDIDEAMNSMLSGPVHASAPAEGFWEPVAGSKEWGRRNGVNPNEAKSRFHKAKQRYHGGATEDFWVNPDTGDIIDSNGDFVDNLEDAR